MLFLSLFFQALDGLDGIENDLKTFNSESLLKYEELQEAIKGCTASTLQKGQILVNKADSHRYSFNFCISAVFLCIYLLLYNLTS